MNENQRKKLTTEWTLIKCKHHVTLIGPSSHKNKTEKMSNSQSRARVDGRGIQHTKKNGNFLLEL